MIENARSGSDKIVTTVDYRLTSGSHVELLRTIDRTKTTGIDIAGNSLNQTIEGNSGTNKLTGYGGEDKLYGNAGNDRLYGERGRIP